MKKFMSIMLGLLLLVGVATVSLAQEGEKKTDEKKKKKGKKKSGDEEKKPPTRQPIWKALKGLKRRTRPRVRRFFI